MSLDRDSIFELIFPSRMVKAREGNQQVGKKPLVVKGIYYLSDRRCVLMPQVSQCT